jgi:ankyrin repeat protein
MTSRAFTSAFVILGVLMFGACDEGVPGTPLAAAARRGDLAEIDRLIALGANVNEPSSRRDWPPIVHAIHTRERAAVVRLLDRGASLDRQGGRTALEMASGYGDAETVRVLLSRGARIPTTDGGAGSLMGAAFAGAWDIDYRWSGCERHTDVVRTLLAHDPRLRQHLPNRVKGLPYSPASLAGKLARVYAGWFVRHKGCDELVRILEG